MGVPVAVEDDDGVSRLQVQAETSGSGAQQEDEELGTLLVEFLEQLCAVLRLCSPCNDGATSKVCSTMCNDSTVSRIQALKPRMWELLCNKDEKEIE